MLFSYRFDTMLTSSLWPDGSVAGSHAMYHLATNVVLATYIVGVQDKLRNRKISKFVTLSKITCGKFSSGETFLWEFFSVVIRFY